MHDGAVSRADVDFPRSRCLDASARANLATLRMPAVATAAALRNKVGNAANTVGIRTAERSRLAGHAGHAVVHIDEDLRASGRHGTPLSEEHVAGCPATAACDGPNFQPTLTLFVGCRVEFRGDHRIAVL